MDLRKSLFWCAIGLSAACTCPTRSLAAANPFSALRFAGSNGLAAFAFSRPGAPPAARKAAKTLLSKIGFLSSPGTITEDAFRISPVFTFDGDINGGISAHGVEVAGYYFAFPQQYHAVSGFLVGAKASGRLHVSLGRSSAFHARYGGMLAVDPANGMKKIDGHESLCLVQGLSLATRVTGCVDASYFRYPLGQEASLRESVKLTHDLIAFGSFHEVSAKLEHSRIHFRGEPGFGQPVITLSATSSLKNGIATRVGLSFGAKAGTNLVMREGIALSATTIFAGKPTEMALIVQDQRGGLFLGKPRRDLLSKVEFSRRISAKLWVNASITHRISTACIYRSTSEAMTLTYRF